jgi:hypothetical protein
LAVSLETPDKIKSLQRKLYCKAKAEPAFRFYLLYDKICREDIRRHAYELSRANAGAPGVDGMTFELVEAKGVEAWLAGLPRSSFRRSAPARSWRRLEQRSDRARVSCHVADALSLRLSVEATTAVRQAEVGSAKTMIDRTTEPFDLKPSRLAGDAGYGSGEMVAWLVDQRCIEPHVKLVDKSERTDATFSRSDFANDPEADVYVCPGG